ncbi:MAG: M15 family metallopeptidase [Candidatus Sericytochromatia bacterium]
MNRFWHVFCGLLLLCLSGFTPAWSQPSPPGLPDLAPLVRLQGVDPRIRVALRFASSEQFLKRPIYPFSHAWVRPELALRLQRAQTVLSRQGYGLKVWDAYRPLVFQRLMWEHVQDENYISHPAKGGRHTRGTAVDVTLVDAAGRELEMPTAYTHFGPEAFRNAVTTPLARKHRALLQKVLVEQGLQPLPTEWWHFDLPRWRQYPVLTLAPESLQLRERSLPPPQH